MAMVRTSLQKVVVFLHRLQRMAISSPRYQKLCKVRGLQQRESGLQDGDFLFVFVLQSFTKFNDVTLLSQNSFPCMLWTQHEAFGCDFEAVFTSVKVVLCLWTEDCKLFFLFFVQKVFTKPSVLTLTTISHFLVIVCLIVLLFNAFNPRILFCDSPHFTVTCFKHKYILSHSETLTLLAVFWQRTPVVYPCVYFCRYTAGFEVPLKWCRRKQTYKAEKNMFCIV